MYVEAIAKRPRLLQLQTDGTYRWGSVFAPSDEQGTWHRVTDHVAVLIPASGELPERCVRVCWDGPCQVQFFTSLRSALVADPAELTAGPSSPLRLGGPPCVAAFLMIWLALILEVPLDISVSGRG